MCVYLPKEEKDEKEEKYITTALLNIVFKKGINYLINDIKDDKTKLLIINEALDKENKEINKYLNNEKSLLSSSLTNINKNGTYLRNNKEDIKIVLINDEAGLDIDETYNILCSSITQVFSILNKVDKEKYEGEVDAICFNLIKNIKNLYPLGNELNKTSILKKSLTLMILKIFFNEEEDSVAFLKILHGLMVITLMNDETWFFDMVFDSLLYPTLYNDNGNSYLLFVSMFLYFLINVQKEIKFKNVNESLFNKKRVDSLNFKNLSFKDILLDRTKHSLKNLMKQLNYLFKVYDSVPSIYYDVYMNRHNWGLHTIEYEFNKEFIFNEYISFLSIFTIYTSNFDELTKEINRLSNNDKTIIKYSLKEFTYGKETDEKQFKGFSSFLGYENYKINQKLLDAIKTCINKTIRNEISHQDRKAIKKEDVIEAVNKGIEKNKDVLFAKSNRKGSKIDFPIQLLFSTNLKDLYLSSFDNMIWTYGNNLIGEGITNSIKQISDNFNLTKDDKKKLYYLTDFNTYLKYKKEGFNVEYYIFPSFKEKDLIFKSKSIVYGFKLKESSINIRSLTVEEASIVASRDYELINGRYRYQYFASDNNSTFIYLNKDELIKRLIIDTTYIEFICEFYVNYDFKNIYLLKK